MKPPGIFKGQKVAHIAPQAKMVPHLMSQLFDFAKKEKDLHPLILSAIFHYELEFIHPFSDGNGRMGRLWQTVWLTKFHPIFEFTPVESMIKNRQKDYYEALGQSDKAGTANAFIEFSLATIREALSFFLQEIRPTPLSAMDRLSLAQEKFKSSPFSRKDYLQIFKTLSTATASRDLVLGVQQGLLIKQGRLRLTFYRYK